MIFISIILGTVGIGFFFWVLFTFAVYALPFFASVTAGLAALHSGAGVIGAIAVGIVAGAITLGAGQFAFALAGSSLIRVAIALLFATPAAIAGYHATLGLAHIGVSSPGWREGFAIIGAILVGGTASARMTLLANPLGSGRPPPPSSAPRFLTAASTEDWASPTRLRRSNGLQDQRCPRMIGNGPDVEPSSIRGEICRLG